MRSLIPATVLAAAMLTAPALADNHAMPSSEAAHASSSAFAGVLADQRRAGDRARDMHRHPAETLAFFHVKPGMTVLDYMPSSGWYTRVLVPYLGASGKYIGLNPEVPAGAPERMANYFGGLSTKFPAKAKEWNLTGASVSAYNSDQLTDEMNGTVDRILIFREIHNMHRMGFLHSEFTRLYSLLKEDGMLGVVQHRAKPWAAGSYTNGSKGYMRQSDVIGLIEAHGFELVATSEINANPKDMANYEGGVWELPPVSRTKNEALKPVGESDRMTLLFRKR